MLKVGKLMVMTLLGVTGLAGAANVTVYNSQTDYEAAITGFNFPVESTLEDFSSVTATSQWVVNPPAVDQWDGFSVNQPAGPTPAYSNSRYVSQLNNPYLGGAFGGGLSYNPEAPAVPGLIVSPDISTAAGRAVLRFDEDNKPFAISFNVVDWNDGSERSYGLVKMSDGSSYELRNPINNRGQRFFAAVLSTDDIKSGVYITELEWLPITSELVGIWDVGTRFGRPAPVAPPKPVPSASFVSLLVLMLLLARLVIIRRP